MRHTLALKSENKQHSRAKVLTLKVHPPVISAFPLLRKTLDTSHHLPWRVPSSGFGEVRYTSGYWEWVEDVLSRCKET
ncbi:hypothetical protein H5410_006764 [Solanum commersonii]|uniref:Uncharacterized protein n=1 Tax=Solanum commersonii TaxID=4109 RepID=A0A9J6ABG5_SOLCO|nr:hypothetical protein H5410_006764 [Solanum commersonii]